MTRVSIIFDHNFEREEWKVSVLGVSNLAHLEEQGPPLQVGGMLHGQALQCHRMHVSHRQMTRPHSQSRLPHTCNEQIPYTSTKS